MPELPDVEGYRRLVAAHFVGLTVRRVEVLDAGVIRNSNARQFRKTVRGRTFCRVDRRGKWLVAHMDGPALVWHFGMTGSLVVVPRAAALDRYDRFILAGDEDELRYRDMRKLGGVWLAGGGAAIDEIIGPQGPDAWTVSLGDFAGRFRARRGAIKPALMDQRVIAGLGNMLSDEVLWSAGVRPARPAAALDSGEVERLHRALRDVLRRSRRAGRIPRTPSWLSSQRDQEQPICPRCHGQLERGTLAGRTALSCPNCQR